MAYVRMVMDEVLRLYPPTAHLVRHSRENDEICGYRLPADGGHRAYFPFGGGPHLCIGNSFALMEGQIILAMIAQRYWLRLQSDQPVEPRMALTLQPKGKVPMVIQSSNR